MIDFPIYHLTLSREALNDFLSTLSAQDRVDIQVNEHGEISFNLPTDCGITVKQIDIAQELFAESDKLDQKQRKLKKNGKRWKELEVEKELCINSAVKVMKILKKYYDDAIID